MLNESNLLKLLSSLGTMSFSPNPLGLYWGIAIVNLAEIEKAQLLVQIYPFRFPLFYMLYLLFINQFY